MHADALKAEEAEKNDVKNESAAAVDLGEEDSNKAALEDSQDRSLIEGGKILESGEPEPSEASTKQDSTMVSVDQLLEKQDEIERLQDLLEKEKEQL